MVVRPVRRGRPPGAVGALRASSARGCIRARHIAAALGVALASPGLARGQLTPAARGAPQTHTVRPGDTLWDIAKSYLGDPFLWPRVYQLNTKQINDPHWIFPGEVLTLPGTTANAADSAAAPDSGRRVARAPIAAPALAGQPSTVGDRAATQSPNPDTVPAPDGIVSTVRTGEYAAAPWVDQKGGPRGQGLILQAADLTGIAAADHSRMKLYDDVFIQPPEAGDAPAGGLYLVYTLGPLLEDFGQIVIPTGVIQVTRVAPAGEATTGRVVRMFGEISQNQHLMVYDTAAAVVPDTAIAIPNGRSGTVRWLSGEPVLASLQDYLVVDIPRGDANPGDRVELYEPRQQPVDGGTLAIPERHIAWGQVLRVSPYGATVVITGQQQPAIKKGTAARIVAKIP